MSMLVQFIVGKFDLFEGNHLFQQLLSGKGGVGVDVQSKTGTLQIIYTVYHTEPVCV